MPVAIGSSISERPMSEANYKDIGERKDKKQKAPKNAPKIHNPSIIAPTDIGKEVMSRYGHAHNLKDL